MVDQVNLHPAILLHGLIFFMKLHSINFIIIAQQSECTTVVFK